MNNENGLFYYAWTFLLLLNILGFIFTSDFSDSLVTPMFKNILGCMLPFYPFYYFAKKDELNANHLFRFFLMMLPATILQFLLNRRQILLDPDFQNVVNNIAYSFVSLLPFLFLIKKKSLITGAIMMLIIIFIIQGAKRGAIIAGMIGFIMYFYYKIKTIESQKRIHGYCVVIIVMLTISVFAYRTYMNNEFLISRMTSIYEGNLSERDVIYGKILNTWYYSENAWNYLFGYGFGASIKIAGEFAHNDWLELLSNFGLIGIFSYLILFYAALKSSLNKEWMNDKRVLMLTITMMWFFISLVSMWYTSMSMSTQTALFGYLLGSRNIGLE